MPLHLILSCCFQRSLWLRLKYFVNSLFLLGQDVAHATGLEVQLGYSQTTITVPSSGAIPLSTPVSMGVVYRLLMGNSFRLHFRGEYTMGMDFVTSLMGGGGGIGYLVFGKEPMVFKQGADYVTYSPTFALELFGGFGAYTYNVTNIVPAPVQKTTGVRQTYQRTGLFMMPYGGINLEFFFTGGPNTYSIFITALAGSSLGDINSLAFFVIRPSVGFSLYF